MKIRLHRGFEKRYQKLSSSLQAKVLETITVFAKNPFEPKLKNHALHGHMIGKRAISVTGNVRIIFEETEHYTLVVLLDVGSHAQVY